MTAHKHQINAVQPLKFIPKFVCIFLQGKDGHGIHVSSNSILYISIYYIYIYVRIFPYVCIYMHIVSESNIKCVRTILFLRHFRKLIVEPGILVPHALEISIKLLVVEGSQPNRAVENCPSTDYQESQEVLRQVGKSMTEKSGEKEQEQQERYHHTLTSMSHHWECPSHGQC